MAQGYEPSPLGLEAAKRHRQGGLHTLALRRVDPEHPTRQWHVHAFEIDGELEIHSHYEYRPEVWPVAGESWQEAIQRAREHFRPSHGAEWGDGTTYVPGKACAEVRKIAE